MLGAKLTLEMDVHTHWKYAAMFEYVDSAHLFCQDEEVHISIFERFVQLMCFTLG